MATYGEFYYKVLEQISNDYLGLHNLNNLQQLEAKIKCYQQFSNKPHDYYECFRNIEQQRETDAEILGKDYGILEEEYKLCCEGSKQMTEFDGKIRNRECSDKFSHSIKTLYNNFYLRKVGSRR